MSNNGKVLATGGAGFIGSNTVDLLVAQGHEVTVVDNLVTGKRENVNAKAKFFKCDICDPKALREAFAASEPDLVLHNAAQVNVRDSLKDPVFDATSNVLGSINVLECCREFGVGKAVYSSSGGAVYGEPLHLPVDEDHQVAPICPYGASKYAVEKYLGMYNQVYGLDYAILRYANVYGPRQDLAGEAGVVAMFAYRMLAGSKITVFDDGEQTRDFVFVGDVASANLSALEKKTRDRVFNIGTGKPTSVNEIIRGLELAVGAKAVVEHAPPIKGEVRYIHLNIERARQQLGFRPSVSLEGGLRKTVEWAKRAMTAEAKA